jgi:hypothetical protein
MGRGAGHLALDPAAFIFVPFSYSPKRQRGGAPALTLGAYETDY